MSGKWLNVRLLNRDPSPIPRRSPISSIADKLLNAARQELGYSADHGQKSKYGAWYATATDTSPSLAKAPWCDSFVSWAGQQAGLTTSVGKFAHTPDHQAWFKAQHAWSGSAERGAVAFLKKDGQVGIVEQATGGRVTTIEALHGAVQRVTRPESAFTGYGLPRMVQLPLYKGTTTASYFWDDGSGRNGDTGHPASGKPMQKGLAASPSWPMGTEGYVVHNGKKAPFFVGDRGPGTPSSSGVMLDLDGKTFAELTGGTWNHGNLTVTGNGGAGHIKVDYVITKWGAGLGKKGAPLPFSTGAYSVNDKSAPAPPTLKFPTAEPGKVAQICAITPAKASGTSTVAPEAPLVALSDAVSEAVATPSLRNTASTVPQPLVPVSVVLALLLLFVAGAAAAYRYTRPRGAHRA
ncbi:CHAP domain-containing protein [Acrocarpospora catenulata]|uniref:CHAP domain-containing protein n=1 Tax=Acrocarpospora catenulata TaxID=2836182 RepID=UPI00355854A4